jgi:hypothetical protein
VVVYFGQLLENYKSSPHLKAFLTVKFVHKFRQKMGWATFWAVFSKTHLVTLLWTQKSFLQVYFQSFFFSHGMRAAPTFPLKIRSEIYGAYEWLKFQLWQLCQVSGSHKDSSRYGSRNRGSLVIATRVARWYIFYPKIQIWVNCEGACDGRCRHIL